ncbi:MAG: HAMP domain-containing histidine kinase [Clostridia bacterium]|nr:HAMP domain-containing histidine kinase [Clostridia bacterium]
MFKSVFSKYVSAFMMIIIISFAVVVVMTLSVVGRYSTEAKKQDMEGCMESASAYIDSMLHGTDSNGIDNLIATEYDNMHRTLDLMALNVDGATLLLLDADDNILLRGGDGETELVEDGRIPTEIKEKLLSTGRYSARGGVDGIFDNVKLLELAAIEGANGEYLGAVAVCSDDVLPVGLTGVIVRVIMSSIIWVLIAALIAVYFISERVIAPLREISSAAKRFASGKFDVRVPVRGSDEVAELATTFNHMAESLDNYDNMRNSFMSNVSHDLRSPMTSIAGFIDGILDGVIPPEQHKYYLQVVSDEVRRLSRLVNSLLDLSRIQAGERKFTFAPFDICEMSRQILISFEQKISAKNLDVEFECPDERINVIADADAIHQVFYNICDNAVKFACDGGKLRISIKRLKGKKLSVEVYNEGQGIAPEDINYVFERFYKSDKSRGLNKNGAGLGLFISKTIMEAHDEQIWVQSEYGKNCCFGFTLECE